MFNFKVFEDIGKHGPIVHEMYLKNIDKNSIDILVNQGEMIKRLRTRQLGQQKNFSSEGKWNISESEKRI